MIKEKGMLIEKSEVSRGVAKSGNEWKRQTIVVEVPYGEGSRSVALQAFGKRVDEMESIAVGDEVEVTYHVSARKYNDRWYNDVSLIAIVATKHITPAAPVANDESLDPQPGDLPF